MRWKLQKWTNLLDIDQWKYKYSSEFVHFYLIFASFQITFPDFNLSETVFQFIFW